jgi:BolA protein
MSIPLTRQERITAKLSEAFQPVLLDVINESHLHAGHHHVEGGHVETYDGTGETHFRVIIVADAFTGLNRVDRHRAINALMGDELATGLHALALEPTAPGEPSRRKPKQD